MMPSLTYPEPGVLRVDWAPLFRAGSCEPLAHFLAGAFEHKAVQAVELDPARRRAHIAFRVRNGAIQAALPKIAQAIVHPAGSSEIFAPFAQWAAQGCSCRVVRRAGSYSAWEVVHQLPGRVRLRNELLRGRPDICRAIDQELMATLGVEGHSACSLTGSVLIRFQPRKVKFDALLRLLDGALFKALGSGKAEARDPDFAICTTSLAVAAAGQYAIPALFPLGLALFLYASAPSYKGAWKLLTKERRLGVDVLDAIIISMCAASGQVFAGAFMSWCLGLGRRLLEKTQNDSRRMLLDAFARQPRSLVVLRGGNEVEIPVEELSREDTVVVKTGAVVPVDGIVREGFGMVDQHALTGESTPAEKGAGERVFAGSLVVGGKVHLAVEKTGSETTSAQIARILNDTLDYRLDSLSRGETLADRAVGPTLALGSLAGLTMGMSSAMAVVNCDIGTGIRIAAPLGMLASLNVCARRGILVKDGRALERLTEVDTILFDKTGTLTRERPEVGRMFAWNGIPEDRILAYAAAAEHRFSHPIALAVAEKFRQAGLPMPATDSSRYHVGYGITVGVDGRAVQVGSRRFLEREGISIHAAAGGEIERIHAEGHSSILVAVDGKLAGALELRAACRPEAREVIAGLRARGVRHMAILSGDHEQPTRRMAEDLGMDRYFAGVLPQEKARYVELLQAEGRRVCFIGDGINDSIALKKADVSISLRGASTIAVDTAQVVFMREGLGSLCQLVDAARDLERNVKRSWKMILIPNSACVLGVFTLGFGLWQSVLFNNVTILLSLLNGLLPLRKPAEMRAEQDLESEFLTHGHATVV